MNIVDNIDFYSIVPENVNHSLLILYESLHKRIFLPAFTKKYARRFLVFQIRESILSEVKKRKKKEEVEENKIMRDRNLLLIQLESLILNLMDLIDFEDYRIKIPFLSEEALLENIALPLNIGQSCFCDVVIVAMFLATNRYDVLLHIPDPFRFLWKDYYLEEDSRSMPWLKFISIDIENNSCFITQKKTFEDKKISSEKIKILTINETKNLVKTFQETLIKIATNMRKFSNTSELNKKIEDLSEEIEILRINFKIVCGLESGFDPKTGKLIQEDTEAMFLAILGIGNFEPLFLSIQMSYEEINFFKKVDNTYEKYDIEQLEEYSIESPSIKSFQLKKEDNKKDITEIIKKDSDFKLAFKEWKISPNDKYIKFISPTNPDLAKDILDSKNFHLRLRTKQIFVKIPTIFVFSLIRYDITGKSEDISISFNNEYINVEILGKIKKYRLLAIACHEGVKFSEGHYILYFRYQDGQNWYYYNDLGPQIRLVDFKNNDEFITKRSKQGYLVWAISE